MDHSVDNCSSLVWICQFQGNPDQIGILHDLNCHFLTKVGSRIIFDLRDRAQIDDLRTSNGHAEHTVGGNQADLCLQVRCVSP